MNAALQRPQLPMTERFAVRAAAESLVSLHNEQLACATLDSIAPAYRDRPEVLAVRQAISESLRQRWERGLQLAQRHIQANPHDAKGWLYFAYCQRQAN